MNKLKFIIKRISILCITLLFGGCVSVDTNSLEDYNIELYKPTYATGFKIIKAKEGKSSIIEITNPWQGANNVVTRLFIARNNEKIPQGFKGEIIKEGAERIVCMSSTQIAMLDMIDSEKRVVGVSGINYISNKYISTNRDSIVDVGYEGNIDYEQIVALNADIVLIYGLNGSSIMEAKLKELNIPFAYIAEYLEESPLGKAEWIVAISEIVGKREEGEKAFSAIPQRYNRLKESVRNIEVASKPKVMINTPYGDSWVMAPNGSYAAQLIADAGGNYIYSGNGNSTRSKAIDIEEAYLMTTNADMWINVGTLSSLKELKERFPKFADTRCVISGEVYNSNKKVNSSGGDDYWESGVVNPDIVLQDLISIFHPELSIDSTVYYHKLK